MTHQPRLIPSTTPPEYCGHLSPALVTTLRTECVLRPGHHGSHAGANGSRWLDTDSQPGPGTAHVTVTIRHADPVTANTAALAMRDWILAERGEGLDLTVNTDAVEPEQLPPNQGPLSGIEVREPCPYCPAPAMIPRTLMTAHLREQHAPQMDACDTGSDTAAQHSPRHTRAASDLRQQYTDALRRWGLFDEVNDPAAPAAFVTTDLLAVRDDELEQARAELARRAAAESADAAAGSYAGRAEQAEAALARVRELHRKATHGDTCVYCAPMQRIGYDTTWPCDTIRALDSTQQPTEPEADRA